MAVAKYKIGSATVLMTTELNNIASNALVLSSSAYSNVQGLTGDGYTLCDLELVVTFVSAPLANKAVYVWFITTVDGSNYEDGSTTITPGRFADVSFPVRDVSTIQRINRRCWLPWGTFKVLVKNDGTGQAFTSSGHALKVRPVTHEGVG